MNKLEIFNKLNPREQCEFVVHLIYKISEDEVEKMYELLEKFPEDAILFRKLFIIMNKMDNDILTNPLDIINKMVPLWIQKLREEKLNQIL